jgi:hypothetical protein
MSAIKTLVAIFNQMAVGNAMSLVPIRADLT